MRIQGIINAKFLPKLSTYAKKLFFSTILNYSDSLFSNKSNGSIASKINNAIRSLERIVQICLNSFTPIFFMLLFSLIMLWSIHLFVGAIFTCWMFCHLIITFYTAKKCLDKSQVYAQDKSQVQNKMLDTFSNIFLVKNFANELYETAYLETYLTKEEESGGEMFFSLEKVRLLMGICSIFSLLLTTLVFYNGWKNQWLTTGDLALILFLLTEITSYLWYFSSEFLRFQEELGFIKDSSHLLKNLNFSKLDTTNLEKFHGHISFQNISFSYNTKKSILKNFNLEIFPGQKVVITGLSGIGKSTIINLLLGHIKPQKGQILIDGKEITSLPPAYIRKHIATMVQDHLVFQRTIKENILYGNLDATDEQIDQIMKDIKSTDFIYQKVDQYQTQVGEKGMNLSGGEKQKICLARTLIKDSNIIILDEPTSNLDLKNEENIFNLLLANYPDKTIIIVAHKFKHNGHVDQFIELDKVNKNTFSKL